MKLYNVIRRHKFVEKIADKHGVTADEVEEILFSGRHFRMVEKGQVKGENLYVAYGQTTSGRYLVIFFIRRRQAAALPISARDMSLSERRYYDEQTKAR